MRLTKNLLALIVLAIGALWSLQGIGVVGGSFMTGQPHNGSISAS
ncbi:hypothetical protein [Mesorhizobium sp. 113-3-9]|nr:hypothetical protein [Mesorhizobium sp. 113-3-9]